jgi:translin
MSLENILKKIQKEVIKKDKIRQEVNKSMRKATQLSKKTIFLIHKEKIEEAKKTIKEVRNLFRNLDSLTKNDRALFYMGSVNSAYQEFSEANIFLKLITENRFVDFKEIEVPKIAYILGLADVIGELRRRTLDSLKEKNTMEAEKCLDLMETIYVELINIDEAQYLTSGLRRKCDVGRRIIEATRGDITIETRRNILENSIKKLEKKLKLNLSKD